MSKTELSCNKINKNSHQNNTTTYLQVLPLTVSYADKNLVNTLLDSGSDSTLISKSLADYVILNFKQKREIKFLNAVSSTTKMKSKLVNFSVSSGSHPGKIYGRNI